MNAEKKLLVVDDEPVVCESCVRIFKNEGIQVDTTQDAQVGLRLATEGEYAAVLLDMKMTPMDGIEFLERLRTSNPEVPVIVITGYASVTSAAQAMRLGAQDYIPKPFTPDEIREAVDRIFQEAGEVVAAPTQAMRQSELSTTTVGEEEMAEAPAARPARDVESEMEFDAEAAPQGFAAAQAKDESEIGPEAALECETVFADDEAPARAGEYFFLGDSWMRPEADGSVCAGFFLPRTEARAIRSIWMPRAGERVYRGLPLALARVGDGQPRVIASPLSGVILEVNHMLAEQPRKAWNAPCAQAWIARIRPERFAEEAAASQKREVALMSLNEREIARQGEELRRLGCATTVAPTVERALAALAGAARPVVVFDAASYAAEGPAMVRALLAARPEARVIVVADGGSRYEKEYRLEKAFYYAVEPFMDREIIDILAAAFRPEAEPEVGEIPVGPLPGAISRISVTNRKGENVTLLISGGALARNRGLGLRLLRKLHESALPVAIDLGTRERIARGVIEEVERCDRLIVLIAEDAGRIPGSLAREKATEMYSTIGEAVRKITTLIVQPERFGEGPLGFDPVTEKFLAEHIAREMTA